MTADKPGVLVMAYGSPTSLDDVEDYYTHIRGGRRPSPELLEELVERYRAIGGRSPLPDITRAQADGIAERLGVKAYVGYKHAPPFIADAVTQMARDGVDRAVGLVLAPHYSTMSIGDYARRAEVAASDAGWRGKLEMIESWHLEPGYIELLTNRVRDAMAALPERGRDRVTVVFTAHSLPARIVDAGDPYPDQLAETAQSVADLARLDDWRVAWQSASHTGEPWLGPDLVDVLRDVAAAGTTGVIVCPCGFVADHLEVLYDVDVEAKKVAVELGLALVRTESPNDDPAFLDTLAAIVRRALPASS